MLDLRFLCVGSGKMKKIIFIENDEDYATIITDVLVNKGYEVEVVHSSLDAIQLMKKNSYDLAIIDMYIDSLTGLQLTELIRDMQISIRVMILTGSVSDEDEIKALQIGVDEYLRKSVSIAVMLERIARIFQVPKAMEVIKTLSSHNEGIELDPNERIVKKNGEVVHLTFLEFDLLYYFLQNKNKLLDRSQIFTNVWKVREDDVVADMRAVDTYVKNLRMKLNITSIYAVRGVGYRWYEE